ncbi:DUF3915 family protein [Bacillus sp. BP-3]|uniref:DUF3915 family protein n=1 Tax=Bacillus sp. BP-3 TaxID=3022773 RepID=UPI00232C6660|nr:DUF3915 family protein [Bacillus sp. BP-3]MDC2867358.1 DUF3915 family protein [Bacillus sp. BP-3]
MFGCFGFDDGHRYDHHKKHDDGHKTPLCNVLKNLSIGTTISLLTIRDNGSFNNVVFEGFSNGAALFSGGNIPGTGLLRVCPHDVVAIVF